MMDLTLTPEQERDLSALLAWAFNARPGIPATATLKGLYAALLEREYEAREAQRAEAILALADEVHRTDPQEADPT